MSRPRLPRLPHTPETRAKIAAARRGRKHTPETKAKISASMQGHVVSDLTKQRISQAKRDAADSLTVLLSGRALAKRRWRWYADVRTQQWRLDRIAASQLQTPHVLEDVIRSGGWTSKRRLRQVPGVSDGYWGKELRALYKVYGEHVPGYAFATYMEQQYGKPGR